MARPRKPTRELFFDTFCDFELADQALILDHLAEFHRQAKRQASKRGRGSAIAEAGEDSGKPAGNGDAAGPLYETPFAREEMEDRRGDQDGV